ncbi:alpha-1,3/alpha-1,6-mannosyltransferase [Monoraphidium neglectum]|uniref:Alpha-1,3/1,6-mannosyltransferase ALG2 n=1 Tax=Monoraphidium neglectum TaxID=145388 RepID=A0A0D2KI68_9CHLO|nr:alpha-1,3/alpha-1,6-mannosyltransferase [Monoraphidium neglectum]KIY95493.1 alpha-1,3/alpha-1,6-mannosyltransferase [Monoraphidium neglectum]|eukprot:XP_013894513.1 alpha-1,3/alpha-1,6-mannosyltransferase [Monoraphidium neglectum]
MPSRNAAAVQRHLEHRPLRIAFVHPDLGLGGAERLVVDAAAELAARGHVVDMYTAYYDPNRCFDETRTGAFSVLVAGGWFPRHVLGRLHALCAVVRCALAALYVAWRVYAGAAPPYDVVIVDQVAATVPVLKFLLTNSRVLFYCHFPDLLLTHRASLLKSLYRAPLDALEQWSTGSSDLILVNSRFTAGVFAATFERIAARGVAPAVLHPAVVVPPEAQLQEAAGAWEGELEGELVELIRGGPAFLSINRCAAGRRRRSGAEGVAEAALEGRPADATGARKSAARRQLRGRAG